MLPHDQILQDCVPFARILEHDLAQQTNRRHAVVEHFVVEFLKRKIFPSCAL